MAININGVEYLNLEEQVQKNKEDIEELQQQEIPEYTAGTGIVIDDGEISVDTDTIATVDYVDESVTGFVTLDEVQYEIDDRVVGSDTGTSTNEINYLKVGDTEYKLPGTTYTAGDNISISGNTISATDTTYTAGDGVTINASNEISAKVGTGIFFDDQDRIALNNASQSAINAVATKSTVSGTNDGTNWTNLTVDGTTYAIPQGGGGGSSNVTVFSATHNNNTISLTNSKTIADVYNAVRAGTGPVFICATPASMPAFNNTYIYTCTEAQGYTGCLNISQISQPASTTYTVNGISRPQLTIATYQISSAGSSTATSFVPVVQKYYSANQPYNHIIEDRTQSSSFTWNQEVKISVGTSATGSGLEFIVGS